jgi:hypothetical protein
MAATLGGTTLPDIQQEGYTEEVFFKESVRRMASGALVRDQVSASAKRRFTLTWAHITSTQLNTVMTALGHVDDGASATYVSPQGTSYTVVLAEDGVPTWNVRTIKAGSEYRYTGTMKLEEV